MQDPGPLIEAFGPIDIYLFDQLVKGRIQPSHRILDAGCGQGRNLGFLVAHGYDVHAVDADPGNVAAVSRRFPDLAPARIQTARVEALSFADASFDVVISNAVLHFAEDHAHFDAMVASMLRVLAPGGMLFARLASNIGIEERVSQLDGGRVALPDGSERYVVDEARLLAWTERAGATLLDPIKTTNVQGLRCMTTWVIRR